MKSPAHFYFEMVLYLIHQEQTNERVSSFSAREQHLL